MLFEVTESGGASREIELVGRRVTIGRDPMADLVLDDSRCSRHHAVIEQSSQGLLIRDAGSRNGVFVNGRLVRRSPLRVGDEILLGNVVIRVLAEMAPSHSAEAHGREHDVQTELFSDSPIVSKRPSDRAWLAADRGSRANARPLMITLLTIAWWLIALSGVISLVHALTSGEEGWAAAPTIQIIMALSGSLIAAVGVVMGAALLARASWARSAHLLLAGAGLASCILTLPSAVLILYFLRSQSELMFDKSAAQANRPDGSTPPRGLEVMFSLGLLLSTALSLALTFVASSLYVKSLGSVHGPRLSYAERAAVDRMRRLASAEEAFRRICNTGYADLSALLHPSTVIPEYPRSGPAFMSNDLAFKRAGRYQFELVTEETMPAAPGCPTLRYRRFRYSATPIDGQGRHFLVGPEGRVHMARDRPATFEDPFIVSE